jgi:hypothetical protein
MAIKILPSITTTNQDMAMIQIEELRQLNLKEAGLFITGLQTTEERMIFMRTVKQYLPDIVFPLVHIRSDSTAEEAEFCLENFGTLWMNIHGNHYKKFQESDLYQFKQFIIAENSKDLKRKHMEHFAGVCLDISHYYEDLHNQEKWVEEVTEVINEYPIRCNHISAAKHKGKEVWIEHVGNYFYDFDYLTEFPQKYFGTTCSCLEIENTIHTQLKYIEYIKKKLCI